MWADRISRSVSDSDPCSPGGWTLPIPTSKVRLPFSCPVQRQGHVTGPGQDLLQLSAERLNRVELGVEGLDLLRAEGEERVFSEERLTTYCTDR